jgi:predicted transcriptional regulator
MSDELSDVHRVLRDSSRRKIIVTLGNSEGISYSDLLNALNTQDRGRINYHLKTLEAFISKKDNGYSLNDKGKTALKQLQDFSYKERHQLATTVKYGRDVAVIGWVIILFLSINSLFSDLWIFGCTIVFSAAIIATLARIWTQSRNFTNYKSTNDTSLHEVLKDENRQKIINLLRENGTQSYTELMRAAQIDSNGKMNYHLSALNDLVTINSKGQYSLNDKGAFAYSSLNTFQHQKTITKTTKPWLYWISPTALSTIYLLILFLLYSKEQISLEVSDINLVSYSLTVLMLFYSYRIIKKLELEDVKKFL